MGGSYACGATGCQKTFERQSGLSSHRKKCSFWQGAEQLRIQRCITTTNTANQKAPKEQTTSQKGRLVHSTRMRTYTTNPRPANQIRRRQDMDNDGLGDHGEGDRLESNKRRRVEITFSPAFAVASLSPSFSREQSIGEPPKSIQSDFDAENERPEADMEDYTEDGEVQVDETPPGPNFDGDTNSDSDQSNARIRTGSQLRAEYLDIQPEGPGPLDLEASAPQPETGQRRITLRLREVFRTATNSFGLFREYHSRPAGDAVYVPGASFSQRADTFVDLPFFRNPSEFLVQYWHWMMGTKKTHNTRETLVEMVNSPHFDGPSLLRTNWKSLDEKLAHPEDTNLDKDGTVDEFMQKQGWKQSEVEIPIPFKGRKTYDPYNESPGNQSLPRDNVFKISNLWTRSIPHLIRHLAAKESYSRAWQWTPFKEYWQPDSEGPNVGSPQRVFGEITSSDAYLKAYEEVQQIPTPGCTLPKSVVAVMLWSDSTHLGNFTDASLHPVYVGFGNESKYTRGEPSSRATHQVAFLPKINDSIHDFLVRLGVPKGVDDKIMSHCRRELMHAVWGNLLDEDFIDGYQNGWVVACEDGVTRRIFPRILTYAADYPEKVMLACIRDKGTHPCPRCYVSKDALDQMGTRQDLKDRNDGARAYTTTVKSLVKRARNTLYGGGSIASTAVDGLLKQKSLVPSINAFVHALGDEAPNHYQILVIDFMHEFELGVWRLIVHHLVRILAARGEQYVREFDKRLRQTPTFGSDTIRKMRNNTSQFKKFAARDYEDLLQTVIPAIEGLLPEPDNTNIMALLFVLASYLSLGKLRLHTEDTLAHWEIVIRVLGDLLRQFRDEICPRYETKETSREAQARARQATNSNASRVDSTRRPKQFNLATYKFHAMGDGPESVRQFGTTDSYSTWIGELLHKRPKTQFGRTAKNKTSTGGVTQIDTREEELTRLGLKYEKLMPRSFLIPLRNIPRPETQESFPKDNHYHIAQSNNDYIHIATWLADNRGREPVATQEFKSKLKSHILSRLRQEKLSESFPKYSDDDLQRLVIQYDKIYTHKRLSIHYTTYDVRRGLDIINLSSGKEDILVTSADVAHPLAYARVLGIYHVLAIYNSRPATRLDLLWVRWYARINVPELSESEATLEVLQFEPEKGRQFGFLDPNTVVRACHLIPAWSHGLTPDAEKVTKGFISSFQMEEYQFYYINKFVDRDMYMRYLGGGVGHVGGGTVGSFRGKTDTEWSDDESDTSDPGQTSGFESNNETASVDDANENNDVQMFAPSVESSNFATRSDTEDDSEESDSQDSNTESEGSEYDPGADVIESYEYSLD